MAQTLTRLLVQVIFSTKDRRNLIIPEVEPALPAYLGGICRNEGSPALAFAEESAGEVRPVAAQEIETFTAGCATEHPVTSTYTTNRTAVYGPVRTVVWEGPGRKARPDPEGADSAIPGHRPGMGKSAVWSKP